MFHTTYYIAREWKENNGKGDFCIEKKMGYIWKFVKYWILDIGHSIIKEAGLKEQYKYLILQI